MTQALTQYETAPVASTVTNDQIALIKRTVAKDATDAELQMYLYDCQRHGVHPLDRLLHFTKRSGKYTPITSIDLLRSRAGDTGELAGIDDPQYQGDVMTPDFRATVTVWRIVQGQRCPFTATARWSEYKPSEDFMWRKMPYLMLGKCAESLALRKAFPRQLAGLYAQEEMDQADTRPQPAHTTSVRANPVTGEVVDTPRLPAPEKPAGDLMARLKELIGEARGRVTLPESARRPINRMTEDETYQAIRDLEAALGIETIAEPAGHVSDTEELPL